MSMAKIAESVQSKDLTSYKLSRKFWDFSFENPDKVRPAHGMIYFFMIEMCNRLAWKIKFGFPTYHAMEATGIKSKNTYYKAFWDLVDWGFVTLIEKSKNGNSANIISLITVSNINTVNDTVGKSALDMANVQLISQHEDSTVPIDKQETNKSFKQSNK